MARNSETGNIKNVTSFSMLETKCGNYGVKYNPPNPMIKMSAITNKLSESRAGQDLVDNILEDYQKSSNHRYYIFKDVPALAARIVSSLIASGATEETVKDAQYLLRKLQGRRAVKIETPPAATEGEEVKTPKTISASQRSVDNQEGFFSRLVILVSKDPFYSPNEGDLKVDNLLLLIAAMEGSNKEVIEAEEKLADARKNRDYILYHPVTGLVNLAKLVKEYVKSLFGSASREYKEMNSIYFRTLGKK